MEGWRLWKHDQDKKFHYKYESGIHLMSAMYECIVQAPVSHVICLFAETDLFTKWMPNIYGMKFLKEISNYRKLSSFK
jgi:hypothetical protein